MKQIASLEEKHKRPRTRVVERHGLTYVIVPAKIRERLNIDDGDIIEWGWNAKTRQAYVRRLGSPEKPNLSCHGRLVLESVFRLLRFSGTEICHTGRLYDEYRRRAEIEAIRPLTLRRVKQIIYELVEQGLLQCRVVSFGRYGRTTEIRIKDGMTPLKRSF